MEKEGIRVSYYDDEFYTELSEFDKQIEEMKASLASSVQKEFLGEMDALRLENESLREFRDKKEEYSRELENVKLQYQAKMCDAEYQANKKRLKELLGLFAVIGYRPKVEYTKGPKCEKCDDERKIHFTSPSGRKMTEDCLCNSYILTYSPKEVKLVSFYVSDKMNSMYFERTEDGDYDRYDLANELYDKNKVTFEEINRYSVVFLKEEDCWEYCDWLNKKEEHHESN